MADAKKGPQTIDFYTFCLSLGSSALVHLGDAPHPESSQATANLVLAQQTIDILDMLAEKTKGNLTPDEERFLESLLVDLKLRFVARKSGKAD